MNNSDANNSADAANVSKYITTLRPMQRVELSRPVNKTPAYAPSGWCGPREQVPNSINSSHFIADHFVQRA